MTTTPTPSEMTWRDFLLSKGAQFKVLATGKVGTFQGFLVRKIAQLPVNIIVDGEYYLENQVELLDSKKLKDEYHGVSTPSDAREVLRKQIHTIVIQHQSMDGNIPRPDEKMMELALADLFDTLLAEKVREAELKAQLGMIEYYDQAPDNESCNWKGLLADNRAQIEYELEAHLKGASK